MADAAGGRVAGGWRGFGGRVWSLECDANSSHPGRSLTAALAPLHDHQSEMHTETAVHFGTVVRPCTRPKARFCGIFFFRRKFTSSRTCDHA